MRSFHIIIVLFTLFTFLGCSQKNTSNYQPDYQKIRDDAEKAHKQLN